MQSHFQPDRLPGFEALSLQLPPDPRIQDGPLAATLVRNTRPSGQAARPAVLYVHGFVDYFFHTELAEKLIAAGYDVYALDLRRAGRSYRPSNLAYFATDVHDYFPEIDWALRTISQESPIRGVIAHSTGGLIMSHYLNEGEERARVGCLILNSPLLKIRASRWEQPLLKLLSKCGQSLPRVLAPVYFNEVYINSLHADFDGEWNFDLQLKPRSGFPVRLGWLSMAEKGTSLIGGGLAIAQPVLTLASADWHRPGRRLRPADHRADLILNTDDMRERGPRLGPHAHVVTLPGAKHDIYLSEKPVREEALRQTLTFLGSTGKNLAPPST